MTMIETLQYSQELAIRLGNADDAQICQELLLSSLEGDGWIQRSYAQWTERLPWVSLNTVKRRMAVLEKTGVLLCKKDWNGNWWALAPEYSPLSVRA